MYGLTPMPLEISGWTIDDFHLPENNALVEGRRVEIVNGVLVELPMPGHQSAGPRDQLVALLNVKSHVEELGLRVCVETNMHLTPEHVPLPDLLVLTPEQKARQRLEAAARTPKRSQFEPIYVTPELVVESVSVGTARHDRQTKRGWYEAAGVPHYWILSFQNRSLLCLELVEGVYVVEASGTGGDVVRSAVFGGTDVPLAELFD